MELLPILRLCWRRRVWIALGAVLAVAAGLIAGPGPSARAGVAMSRVALDTPDSQIIHSSPKGAETLQWRTELFAHLLSSEDATRRIAGSLGKPADQVVVIDELLETPTEPTTLPLAAAQAAAVRPEPYALTVRYEPHLPIIALEAHAPHRAAAVALAEAATTELRSYASSPPGDSDRLQGVVVEPVAKPLSEDVDLGSGPVKAVAASVITFGLWTAGVLLLPVLLGGRRGRRRVQAA